MAQHKAASLTSGLFARKGRASPASLLIAEMEVSTPEIRDLQPKHGPDAPAKLNLNGSAAALKKGPKAREPEELPLLAFVEAQVAEEVAEQRAEAQAGGAAPARAEGEDAAAKVAGELPPAASLLDSTAQALRQANGRGPATAGGVLPAVVAAADGIAPEGAVEAPQEVPEVETVSGDANVAAIEDAPQEDFGEEDTSQSKGETLAAKAPAEDAGEQVSANSGAAPAAPLVFSTVGATPVSLTPAAARKLGAEAALSATVALRQAVAQRATPMPAPEAAPMSPGRASFATPAPPRNDGGALPWRSAAVIALGMALGLGAYVALSGGPAAPPPVQSAADSIGTEGAASTVVELPLSEDTATAPIAAAPATDDGVTSGTSAPSAAALPEPSFDIIRIEPDGQSIVAGRAAPGSEWILLNNGKPIASVRADVNGEWVVLPDASLVPGANAFSLVPKTERGKVAVPAPAAEDKVSRQPAAPRPGADTGAALVPPSADPVSDGVRGEDSKIALPMPKPPVPASAEAAVPRVELAEGGAYELQVASVRQSAAAARERDRLAAAFPELLGALELRVQEASVDGAGTFFRVRSGAIADLGAAREVCRRLEAAGQGCLVVRRPSIAAPPAEVVQEDYSTPPAPEQQARRP